MQETARKRKWRGLEKVVRGVGDFYFGLAHHLLGGELVTHERQSLENGDCDIYHEDWGAKIEVKGFASSNSPLIFTDQLARHLDVHFPLSWCWYAIFAYYNPDSRHHSQKRIGRIARTPEELQLLLAKRTRALWLLDARILRAIHQNRGASSFWRNGGVEETVRLGMRSLRRLEVRPAESLRAIGLKPSSFPTETGMIKTVFRGQEMEFQATWMLPKAAWRLLSPLQLSLFGNGTEVSGS